MERPRSFVPADPTLWPGMLFPPAGGRGPPLGPPDPDFHYFARNGIWLLARLLGISGGEVLVPAYHHGVEIEALVDAGARPVYYRVDRRWQVDLADVERRIGRSTRAIYLIHYCGLPGPAEDMKRLADRRGVPLIEDCALSLLSADGDRPLGSVGDVAVFCLYKTLPVPNGGMVVWNGRRRSARAQLKPPPILSTASAAIARLLANLELRGGEAARRIRAGIRRIGRAAMAGAGVRRVPVGTDHFQRANVGLGMSRFSARILGALDLRTIAERRRRNYLLLLEGLREAAKPIRETLPPGACPLFYPLEVGDKERVRLRLLERGIEAIDFWRNFHPSCEAARFPEAAWLRDHILEVPCHQDLDPARVEWMARSIRDALPVAGRSGREVA
jgi:perosamine synthetase